MRQVASTVSSLSKQILAWPSISSKNYTTTDLLEISCILLGHFNVIYHGLTWEVWFDVRINVRHKIRWSASTTDQHRNLSEEGWKLKGILYSEVAEKPCTYMLNIFCCI